MCWTDLGGGAGVGWDACWYGSFQRRVVTVEVDELKKVIEDTVRKAVGDAMDDYAARLASAPTGRATSGPVANVCDGQSAHTHCAYMILGGQFPTKQLCNGVFATHKHLDEQQYKKLFELGLHMLNVPTTNEGMWAVQYPATRAEVRSTRLPVHTCTGCIGRYH